MPAVPDHATDAEIAAIIKECAHEGGMDQRIVRRADHGQRFGCTASQPILVGEPAAEKAAAKHRIETRINAHDGADMVTRGMVAKRHRFKAKRLFLVETRPRHLQQVATEVVGMQCRYRIGLQWRCAKRRSRRYPRASVQRIQRNMTTHGPSDQRRSGQPEFFGDRDHTIGQTRNRIGCVRFMGVAGTTVSGKIQCHKAMVVKYRMVGHPCHDRPVETGSMQRKDWRLFACPLADMHHALRCPYHLRLKCGCFAHAPSCQRRLNRQCGELVNAIRNRGKAIQSDAEGEAEMIERRQFYINGQWVDPLAPHDFEVINPATEEPAAIISLGTAADVDRAVAAAKAAFPAFRAMAMGDRRTLLDKLHAIMKRRLPEWGDAISLEMGAPIDFARGDQAGCGPWHSRGFLDALDDFEWEKPFADGQIIVREPIGVVGLITPWNWPVNQIVLKVLPALAVGCTCVLKPSEIAPLSALLFAEMVDEAGFPAGVFNLVNGDGPGVGEAMSAHPDIAMMSFTGSARGGAAVTRGSAETVKRVSLELGGKSPNIIFADADIARAIPQGVTHCMENTGQSCNAPTRMIVARAVYDEAVDLARQAALNVKVGAPTEHGDHIGPLVSQAQFDKVQGLIETAIAEGARLVAGGMGRPDGFNRGYYVRPTVFADVTNDMTIAREEVFGPVLAMIPFDGDEDEAIALANDTPYGLAAYLWTGDKARADRVARKLDAGMVRANGGGLAVGHPFGGYKQSGNGREGGMWGLEDFTETKIISIV